MGAFEYSALDTRGRRKRGVMEGDTPRHVRSLLREQGLTPVQVDPVAEKSGGRRPRFATGVSATGLALFTRQLSILVHSGLPLEQALSAVAQQTESRSVQRMVLSVRAGVNEGHSLADAMRGYGRAFPNLYTATVAAGEQSGHLDTVLDRLADYVENRQRMRQKVSLALFYPAILTLVAVGVVISLLTYVVPQVVQVFTSMDTQLPLLTRGLIAFSGFLREYGLVLLVALALAIVAARYALKREHLRYRAHRSLLRLPLIGRLTRSINTGRLARTFSILVGSGVPVLEAMHICTTVVSNLPMRAAVATAAERVREGSAINTALATSKLFPPITVHLIASGESSGQLDRMLERAADHQEHEVETLIAALLTVFEPLLILAMGGVVLIIVLAILLPIFDLNQLVK